MVSYKWFLSSNQPLNKNTLLELQTQLLMVGIYLDLSWDNDNLQMTIAVPDEVVKAAAVQKALEDRAANGPLKRRGRPSVEPENDISLASVYHMQSMGIPAKDIARKIGVSKRTFYRRLEQARRKSLDPSTPFSQWA